MSESPFVNFYTSDFLAGTSGLTASVKGVYITILCLMYESEAPLTQSWETLARRCGCTLPAFKKAVETLTDDDKITVSGGAIWSEKCEKHITLRRERQNSARAAAKTRWEKTKEKQGEVDADAIRTQCQPKPEPYNKEEDTKVSSKKKRGCRLPDDWSLPREWGDWALSQQYPETAIRIEAEKFADFWHSKSGAGATKLDWFATWRNWMRNSKAPRVFGGGSDPPGIGAGTAALERRRQRREES